jgi:hypothetical protein
VHNELSSEHQKYIDEVEQGPDLHFFLLLLVYSYPSIAADNEGKNSNNKSARTYCIETILYLDERE